MSQTMSRPVSPYLSLQSPRLSTARSRRRRDSGSSTMSSMSIPLKATKSFSAASMAAMDDVRDSQILTKKNPSKANGRPSDLPDAESLYDELQATRKEIATQRKVIKKQQTRNGRLEAELKKRESQLADIFDGNERKSKNDQLQARILHLEFELREKNDELAKLKFDQQTNNITELKKANKIYADELDRLKKIIFDRMEVNKAKIQTERKQQILKDALSNTGSERETLRLENEKYRAQLDSLKDANITTTTKQKKELEHLRNELRKARVNQSKTAIASGKGAESDAVDNSALKAENEHLKAKIDRMAAEAKEHENTTAGTTHTIDKLENTISDLQLTVKETEQREQAAGELIEQLRRELAAANKRQVEIKQVDQLVTRPVGSRRSSLATSTVSKKEADESDIVGALTAHIYRTDLTTSH